MSIVAARIVFFIDVPPACRLTALAPGGYRAHEVGRYAFREGGSPRLAGSLDGWRAIPNFRWTAFLMDAAHRGRAASAGAARPRQPRGRRSSRGGGGHGAVVGAPAPVPARPPRGGDGPRRRPSAEAARLLGLHARAWRACCETATAEVWTDAGVVALGLARRLGGARRRAGGRAVPGTVCARAGGDRSGDGVDRRAAGRDRARLGARPPGAGPAAGRAPARGDALRAARPGPRAHPSRRAGARPGA